METEKTEGEVDTTNNEGEGESTAETITISKMDWEKSQQTIGSMKRELKDLKKPKETPTETPQQTKPDDNRLLEKAFLRSAQITNEEEVELALSTAKKWDLSIDKLVDDEDFKVKLDKLRIQKANEVAVSNVRGGGGKPSAKESVEYWVAKGTPPSPADVPDRKTRVAIVKALMANTKGTGKKFYND